MSPQAGIIGSNLKEATQSYDEELSLTPEQEAYLASLEVRDRKITEEEMELMDKEYALSYASAEPQRWAKQELWQGPENEEMRLTRIMHPHAVFELLQRAGVDARIDAPTHYVMGVDDKTGLMVPMLKQVSSGRLWLHDDTVKGKVGVSAWVHRNGERVRRCVTSLQYPYGPEWSIMRFNEYNVPTVEKYRGWRTAMLQLILAGVLTEEEVDRAFGPATDNDASWFYRQVLLAHRQKRNAP